MRGQSGPVRFPTDIVVMPQLPSAQRIVRAGDAIGHYFGLSGTLGLAVADAAGRQYALTCGHVVAPYWTHPKGDKVESPPDADGKPGANVIGTVEDWTVLDARGTNTVDVALVECNPQDVVLSNAPLGLGAVPSFSPLTLADYASLGNVRVKVHSKREVLDGVIDSVANNLLFDFSGRLFRFSDVLSYAAAVEPGDSGSAVYDAETRDVLGVHFAGLPLDRTGYAIPTPNILTAFDKYDLRVIPT
jgi:hypothetical protein